MIIAALDIGSSKICIVFARIHPNKPHTKDEKDEIEIVAVSRSNSAGVEKGNIVDLKSLTPLIASNLQEASRMAGTGVDRVCVNLNGEYVESYNVRGVISLASTSHQRPIEARDIQRVRESAQKSLSLPMERVIVHILPQQYIVDDVTGVRNPLEMQASRLEAEFHVVTASQTVVNNILRALQKSNLEASSLILNPLAAAYGVLTDYEREQGVLVIEIGAESTGFIVIHDNSVYHSSIMKLGGHLFTTDLATVLKISVQQAERLKRMCSSMRVTRSTPETPAASPSENELIEIPSSIPGTQPQAVPLTNVKEILDARSTELMVLIRDHLTNIHMIDLIHHVVLTGGGSLIIGIDSIAQNVFDLPARIGYPVNIEGLNDIVNSPIYSVAIGMIQFIAQQEDLLKQYKTNPNLWQKMTNWVRQVLP